MTEDQRAKEEDYGLCTQCGKKADNVDGLCSECDAYRVGARNWWLQYEDRRTSLLALARALVKGGDRFREAVRREINWLYELGYRNGREEAIRRMEYQRGREDGLREKAAAAPDESSAC